MKPKTQTQRVLEFVERNPNCQCTDVYKGTGIIKENVTSVLNKLYFDHRVRRVGERGNYHYTICGPAEPPVRKPKKIAEQTDIFGCANPLTLMFNQCLMQVRGSGGQGASL